MRIGDRLSDNQWRVLLLLANFAAWAGIIWGVVTVVDGVLTIIQRLST